MKASIRGSTGARIDLGSLPGGYGQRRGPGAEIKKISQVRRIIESLDKRVALRHYPDDLLESIGILIDGCLSKGATLEDIIFYRARKMNVRLFTHLAEIQYPPKESAPKGRLNRNGDPILYAAFTQAAALVEIGTVAGEIIAMAIIKERDGHKNEVQWFPVGIAFGPYATPARNVAETLVLEYLNREITKGVEKGAEHKYHSTIAIAHNFFHSPILRPREGIQMEAGLIYPSAKVGEPLDEGTYNVALPPAVYNAHYYIAEVRAYFISRPSSTTPMDCHLINVATVGPGDRLQWHHTTYDEMVKHCPALEGRPPIYCGS